MISWPSGLRIIGKGLRNMQTTVMQGLNMLSDLRQEWLRARGAQVRLILYS